MTTPHTYCGACGKAVPVDGGYVPWCECGWNLRPAAAADADAAPRRGLLPKLYAGLGRRRGQAVFERLLKGRAARPRFAPAALYALAVAIQMLVLFFLLTGLSLVVTNYTNLIMLALGLSLVGFAWLGRPRFGAEPPAPLAPEKFAGLHGLVGRVAAALDTEPPRAVVVNEEFNAAVARRGVRQRKVLFIGLPLFSVLDPQERVALVAHEMAHFAGGDPARGVLVSLTTRTLEEWHHLLHREHLWPRENAEGGLFGFIAVLAEAIANVLFRLLSWLPRLLLLAVVHLAWDGSQAAEYRADLLGARVSGADAFARMSEKTLFAPRLPLAAQAAALNQNSPGALEELRAQFRSIPPREFERARRLAQAEQTRLDDTHPPTALRLRLLRERGPVQPTLVLTDEENAALDEELQPLVATVNRRLESLYLNSLYY